MPLLTRKPAEGDSEVKKPSRNFPRSLFVAGTVMFIFMVAAVALPDYFHYQIRLKQLELLQSHSPSPSPPQNTQAPNPSSPLQNSPASTAESDSPNLFESYARFLTLLAGFVSVLAFFLGFFIRRSIRETEEDIDKRVTRSLDDWKKSYGEQSAKLETKLKEVEQLKGKLVDLEARYRSTFQSYIESQEKVAEPASLPDTSVVANAVDRELEESETGHEGTIVSTNQSESLNE